MIPPCQGNRWQTLSIFIIVIIFSLYISLTKELYAVNLITAIFTGRTSQVLLDLSLRITYPATNQLIAVTVARAPMCRKGAVDWQQSTNEDICVN